MKITKTGLALFVALILLAAIPLTVTNFTQVHINRMPQGGTATPRFFVTNLDGPSDIIVAEDNATPVFAVRNDGAVEVLVGPFTTTGNQTVTGNFTVTDNVTLGDAADDTLTVSGNMVLNGIADTDTGNYDNFLEITGNMTGKTTKDRYRGLLIDMTRPAGSELNVGDHDDVGLKVRVDTEAITTTTGTVLRAGDFEAKADNPDGTVTNLFGIASTAKSDTGAGSVDNMVAFQTNAQNNAAVVTNLISADFRLMRQAATVPTNEYVIQVRSSSTTGSGADAGIFLSSDYGGSATTDSLDYGLDVSGAAINIADVRLENGETISNQTDTVVQIGAFFAFEEGAVVDLANGATITPLASYQPLTAAGAEHSTTDASTAIADGPIPGTWLVLCNEDATYNIVVKDGANTLIGGDVTLTAGQDDCLTVIWNGADWVGQSDKDN